VHCDPWNAVIHFALGLAGEVGELINLIKKVNRDPNAKFQDQYDEIRLEMADILIYLCDLAAVLQISLGRAITDKRKILVERWGEP
jgi:NTP pyrophosphatase (non-canonical NTP hydrolase)